MMVDGMRRVLVAVFSVAILLALLGAEPQKAISVCDGVPLLHGRSIALIDAQTGFDSVSLAMGENFFVDAVLDGVTDFLNSFQVAVAFDNMTIECAGVEVPRYGPRYVFYDENFTMGFISVMNWQGIAVAGSSLLPKEYIVRDGVTPVMRYVNSSGEKLLCRFNFTAVGSGASKIEFVLTANESNPFNTFLTDSNNRTLDFTPKSFRVNIYPAAQVEAEMRIMPRVLNLRSHGRYVIAVIRFVDGFNGAKVNISSVLLNGTIAAEPRGVWICDCAGLLMVKFDRQALIDLIRESAHGIMRERVRVTLTITGKFKDGRGFEANDTIWVISDRLFRNQDRPHQTRINARDHATAGPKHGKQ
jgi:hypothetical protein